jgi:uncharacterized protein (TIGR04222 family)
MNSYAAEATWGVPGPTFLLLYLGAAAVVAVLAVVHRRVSFAGPAESRTGSLGAQQVAFLNGGERLAVYTALGGLRAAGAVDITTGRALVQSAGMPAGATPLDAAIYNAAGRRARVRDLSTEQWVIAALAQLRDGLITAGLVPGPAQRRTLRLWAAAGVGLILIGVARLLAGVANGRPVGWLIASLVAVVLLTVFLTRSVPRRTRAGTAAVDRLRTQHHYLAPASRPSYATYGAAGSAMGVALYGASTLYLVDPAFAAEAEIQRQAAGAGGTGSTGSSCGGSSSTSCGGGGSGCGGGGGGCGG